MKLSEILSKIKENPEDLSQLPDAIAMASAAEEQEARYQERIASLQETNRTYLNMIPVPGTETPTAEAEEEETTLEEEVHKFLEAMKEL